MKPRLNYLSNGPTHITGDSFAFTKDFSHVTIIIMSSDEIVITA